jgi:hypothetical protein
MKPKLVEIEWTDARSVYDCFTLKDAPARCQLVERHTVGYIVLKDRERGLIAGTYDPHDEHDEEGGCDWTVIPRGWVKKITELAASGKSEEA